jgi:hypothetical protein
MWTLKHFRRLVRCTSGTATLEAVIAIPVAISLMAGGVGFGLLYSAYGTAGKSMRDAVRYLARVPNSDADGLTSAYICGWGLNGAKNLAVFGKINPSDSDRPLVPGWNPNSVTLQSPSCNETLTSPIIIELRSAIPYTGLMFRVLGLSNTWTLNVRHQEVSIGE